MIATFQEVVLQSHGLRIALRSNVSGLLDQVLARSAAFAEPVRGEAQLAYSVEQRRSDIGLRYSVRWSPGRVWQTSCPREALDWVLRLMQLKVAEDAPGQIFVHAGVVAWNGHAILLPGRTFTGKTSLVVALLRRGATYYSDEYAVLDAYGKVHPYPRPLQVRSDYGFSLFAPHMLGASVGSEPMDVSLLVFARFQEASTWRSRPITPGNAMLRLLANTVCARKRTHEALACLRLVARNAPAFCALRGEGDHAVSHVLDLLTKRP